MQPHLAKLTTEEQARNKHGPMCLYSHADEIRSVHKETAYFSGFTSHAQVTLMTRDDIFVPREKLIKGLSPDFDLNVYYPGFPTLRHLQHTAHLEKAKVRAPLNLNITSNCKNFLRKAIFIGKSISTSIYGRQYDFNHNIRGSTRCGDNSIGTIREDCVCGLATLEGSSRDRRSRL